MTALSSAAAQLHPLLADRWSPRGFAADHELDELTLTALLEAARWAPSAANTQPWRFAVARRGEPGWAALVETLAGGNQVWAHRASALVVVAAGTVGHDGSDRPWALYDAGQAAAHLTVQAQHLGLAVHQMGGFDRDAVSRLLPAVDGLTPVVVLAVGAYDASADLPAPLAERERAPRERLPLGELVLPLAADAPAGQAASAA